jgi:hypothetical protein
MAADIEDAAAWRPSLDIHKKYRSLAARGGDSPVTGVSVCRSICCHAATAG